MRMSSFSYIKYPVADRFGHLQKCTSFFCRGFKSTSDQILAIRIIEKRLLTYPCGLFIFERIPRYNTHGVYDYLPHDTNLVTFSLLPGHSRFWTVAAVAGQSAASSSGPHILGFMPFLIIPNSIHPKPRLLDFAPRYSCQPFSIPPVHFHQTNLVICQSHPFFSLFTSRIETDGIAVASTRRCWLQT